MAEPATLDEWLEFISSVHPKDMDLGLERVAAVAATLAVSQPAASVVTIAGTNGKGSTTAALEAILVGSGLEVGATFSPHLNRFNERIRLRGEEASDEQICRAFAAVKAASGDIPLTYFEFAALAALFLFREAEVDVALLEIGLGGRLDAFNLVDADVAVVTSIGLDHQDYLGDDLESIGREKAGIFRPARPVVLGTVTESVYQAARELECPQLRLGEEFRVERGAADWCYRNDAMDLDIEQLAYGSFAPDNCALALTAACLVLEQRRMAIEPGRLANALAAARLAGRMELHDCCGAPVVLDVAHNPAAAEFLCAELGQRWPERRYVAIYGALEDKDAVGVQGALDSLVLHWLLVPTFGWRGQTAEQLAARLGPGSNAEICPSMAEALSRAHSLTASGNGILAFGSFSAVEQARELLIAPGKQTDGGWSDGE